MEECLETIKTLSDDIKMREEYRKMAYHCYNWYDSKYVFNDMFNVINGA
jgi:hypothetical protein